MLPTPAPRSTLEPGDLLSVTTVPGPHPGRAVVEVVGEVDACTAPVLEACLRTHATRPGVRELVVHLQRVGFLGAAGVGVLARTDRRCRARGARLVVRTGGRRAVLRPLELTGLTGTVAVDPADGERSRPCGPRPGRRPRTAPHRPPARRARRVGR
ncbi:STAS domain-containing protein [Geodermatophilus sp. SYSU D00815]